MDCQEVGGRKIITIFRHSHFSHFDGFTHVKRKSLKNGKHNLTFLSRVVGRCPRLGTFSGTSIVVPGAIILYASVFSRFVSAGRLCRVTLSSVPSRRVVHRFRRTHLPRHLVRSLVICLSIIHRPVTVHSSSLLRSTRCRPFTNVCSACVVPCISYQRIHLGVLYGTVGNICTSMFCHSDGTCVATADGIVSRRGVTIVLRRITKARCNRHFCPGVSNMTHSVGCCPVKSRGTRRNAIGLTLNLKGCVISNKVGLQIYPTRPSGILRADRVRVTLHRARARFCTLKIGTIRRRFDISSKFGLLGISIHRTRGSNSLRCVTSACSPCSVVVHSNICSKKHGLIAFYNILRRNIFPLPRLLHLVLGFNHRDVHQRIRIRFTIGLGGGHAKMFCPLRVHPVISGGVVLSRRLSTVTSRSALVHSRGTVNRKIAGSICSIICIGARSCSTFGGPTVTSRVSQVGHRFLRSKNGCILINPNH